MFVVNYTDYAARWNKYNRKEFSTEEELNAFLAYVNKYLFDVEIDSVVKLKSK